jgi:hypothetical protein
MKYLISEDKYNIFIAVKISQYEKYTQYKLLSVKICARPKVIALTM